MAGQAAFASLFALPEEEAAHIPQEDPVAEDCEVKRCKLTNLGSLDLAEEMEMKDGKEETPKPSTSMWAALEQQCARKAPVKLALENTNAPLALEDIQAQRPLAIEDIPSTRLPGIEMMKRRSPIGRLLHKMDAAAKRAGS